VPETFSKSNPIDIVVFCGSPGAGKSSFYWRHLQPLGYGRVNQDILKSVSHITLPQIALKARVVQPPRSLGNIVETAREMPEIGYRIG
jgi:hypothetical protein